MGNVVKYAAVNSKVKALEGKFLSNAQYKKLVESANYNAAVKFLKEETAYVDALKDFNVEELHRGELEIILKRYFIEKIFKLRYYFSGEYKILFKTLFMRFEIEDLKIILRGKYIGKSKEEIVPFLMCKKELSQIDYATVTGATNIEMAIEKLKNTIYYKHLAPLVSSISEDGLFRIETTLDFQYFSSLRKLIKKLPKEDSKVIEKFIGINSDLLNLQWIYRGKKYYKISQEELLNYTIYDGYYLKRETLKKLCYSKDLDQFFEMISVLKYKDVFNKEEAEYLEEKNILSYLKKIYEGYKRENKLNISVVMAYIELLIMEIRNIISIVENIRYSTGREEAMKYITVTLD